MNRFRSAALLLAFVSASCRHTGEPVPEATFGCSERELARAWADVAGSLAQPGDAQALADAVLCRPAESRAEAYVRARLADQLTIVSYGTGDLAPERSVVDRSEIEGDIRTFHGSPEFIYGIRLNDSGDIVLEGRNEACIEAVLLSHRPLLGGWVVSGYDSACD